MVYGFNKSKFNQRLLKSISEVNGLLTQIKYVFEKRNIVLRNCIDEDKLNLEHANDV